MRKIQDGTIEKQQINMFIKRQSITGNKDLEIMCIIDKLHTGIENIVLKSEDKMVILKGNGDLNQVDQDTSNS